MRVKLSVIARENPYIYVELFNAAEDNGIINNCYSIISSRFGVDEFGKARPWYLYYQGINVSTAERLQNAIKDIFRSDSPYNVRNFVDAFKGNGSIWANITDPVINNARKIDSNQIVIIPAAPINNPMMTILDVPIYKAFTNTWATSEVIIKHIDAFSTPRAFASQLKVIWPDRFDTANIELLSRHTSCREAFNRFQSLCGTVGQILDVLRQIGLEDTRNTILREMGLPTEIPPSPVMSSSSSIPNSSGPKVYSKRPKHRPLDQFLVIRRDMNQTLEVCHLAAGEKFENVIEASDFMNDLATDPDQVGSAFAVLTNISVVTKEAKKLVTKVNAKIDNEKSSTDVDESTPATITMIASSDQSTKQPPRSEIKYKVGGVVKSTAVTKTFHPFYIVSRGNDNRYNIYDLEEPQDEDSAHEVLQQIAQTEKGLEFGIYVNLECTKEEIRPVQVTRTGLINAKK